MNYWNIKRASAGVSAVPGQPSGLAASREAPPPPQKSANLEAPGGGQSEIKLIKTFFTL